MTVHGTQVLLGFFTFSISGASSGVKPLNPRFLPSRNNSSFARKATCSEGLTKMTFNLLLPPLAPSTWSLFSFVTACCYFSVCVSSSSSSDPDNSGGSYSFKILSNKNLRLLTADLHWYEVIQYGRPDVMSSKYIYVWSTKRDPYNFVIELLIASSAPPQWLLMPPHPIFNDSSITPQWLLINSSKTLHNEPDKGEPRFSRHFSMDNVDVEV